MEESEGSPSTTCRLVSFHRYMSERGPHHSLTTDDLDEYSKVRYVRHEDAVDVVSEVEQWRPAVRNRQLRTKGTQVKPSVVDSGTQTYAISVCTGTQTEAAAQPPRRARGTQTQTAVTQTHSSEASPPQTQTVVIQTHSSETSPPQTQTVVIQTHSSEASPPQTQTVVTQTHSSEASLPQTQTVGIHTHSGEASPLQHSSSSDLLEPPVFGCGGVGVKDPGQTPSTLHPNPNLNPNPNPNPNPNSNLNPSCTPGWHPL